MKVTIDLNQLGELKKEAEKILFSPEAEESILKLLEMRDTIDEAIKEAERRVEEKALALNPNFKSVQSDRVRVFYRSYGSKYSIDRQFVDQLPKDIYTTTIRYNAITAKVEELIEAAEGKIPQGIVVPERPKKMSFSVKVKKEAKNG